MSLPTFFQRFDVVINLHQQIPYYLQLMRFNKPIGIFLLLWPTLWAIWIASQGKPSIKMVLIFVCGVVVMRAVGCIVNDFADRHVDKYVKRTKMRPLANGAVNIVEAIVLFVILSLIALSLVLLLNRLTVELAMIGIVLGIIYPFLKRVTHFPQIWLGIVFSWSVPMAFTAVTGHIPVIAWILFLATMLWPIAYDTQYAMVDREDDIKVGIKSTAILFGCYDILVIALLQSGLLIVLGILGWYLQFNHWFYLGLLIALGFMSYQQILIRHRNPINCFAAFQNNNWAGFFVFLGIVLAYTK